MSSLLFPVDNLPNREDLEAMALKEPMRILLHAKSLFDEFERKINCERIEGREMVTAIKRKYTLRVEKWKKGPVDWKKRPFNERVDILRATRKLINFLRWEEDDEMDSSNFKQFFTFQSIPDEDKLLNLYKKDRVGLIRTFEKAVKESRVFNHFNPVVNGYRYTKGHGFQIFKYYIELHQERYNYPDLDKKTLLFLGNMDDFVKCCAPDVEGMESKTSRFLVNNKKDAGKDLKKVEEEFSPKPEETKSEKEENEESSSDSELGDTRLLMDRHNLPSREKVHKMAKANPLQMLCRAHELFVEFEEYEDHFGEDSRRMAQIIRETYEEKLFEWTASRKPWNNRAAKEQKDIIAATEKLVNFVRDDHDDVSDVAHIKLLFTQQAFPDADGMDNMFHNNRIQFLQTFQRLIKEINPFEYNYTIPTDSAEGMHKLKGNLLQRLKYYIEFNQDLETYDQPWLEDKTLLYSAQCLMQFVGTYNWKTKKNGVEKATSSGNNSGFSGSFKKTEQDVKTPNVTDDYGIKVDLKCLSGNVSKAKTQSIAKDLEKKINNLQVSEQPKPQVKKIEIASQPKENQNPATMAKTVNSLVGGSGKNNTQEDLMKMITAKLGQGSDAPKDSMPKSNSDVYNVNPNQMNSLKPKTNAKSPPSPPKAQQAAPPCSECSNLQKLLKQERYNKMLVDGELKVSKSKVDNYNKMEKEVKKLKDEKKKMEKEIKEMKKSMDTLASQADENKKLREEVERLKAIEKEHEELKRKYLD